MILVNIKLQEVHATINFKNILKFASRTKKNMLIFALKNEDSEYMVMMFEFQDAVENFSTELVRNMKSSQENLATILKGSIFKYGSTKRTSSVSNDDPPVVGSPSGRDFSIRSRSKFIGSLGGGERVSGATNMLKAAYDIMMIQETMEIKLLYVGSKTFRDSVGI